MELLQLSMTAMNAPADPDNAEERKGCSGHVGKMVFSAGVSQLAMVAYVPEAPLKNGTKIDISDWGISVCNAVGGKILGGPEKADSPNGGLTLKMSVAADAEKGKFPLKDKDTAMQAAFAYLRSKGAFPEDDGDDDDSECAFGDDAFDNL